MTRFGVTRSRMTRFGVTRSRVHIFIFSLSFQTSRTSMNLSYSYNGVPRTSFGTPSYPSPLDRIRTGVQERGVALGLSANRHPSYEGNQSFPKTSARHLRKPEAVEADTPTVKKTLQDFTGNLTMPSLANFTNMLWYSHYHLDHYFLFFSDFRFWFTRCQFLSRIV